MPTPAAIISMVASLQNDTAQTKYTNAACLPYLNMALDELQETFEQNNVPVTNETSAVINIPAGVFAVGFDTPPYQLPLNLVEIQQLWESPEGLEQWTPVVKKDFLPHWLQNNTTISQFLIWAWMNQEIRLIAANADNDLKIDYIQSIFQTPISISDVNIDIPIVNVKSYLGYKTAALCSMYIGENETRAEALNDQAESALYRTLGISTKGRQSIVTKRRPFRAAWKARVIG